MYLVHVLEKSQSEHSTLGGHGHSENSDCSDVSVSFQPHHYNIRTGFNVVADKCKVVQAFVL